MITDICEFVPGIFRLLVAPTDNFSYNSFLIIDEHPLLIHTGRLPFFETTSSLAREVIDLEKLKYITFSHFEADECSALNEWLKVAPHATTLVGSIGKASIDDFASRTPQCVHNEQRISLGQLELVVLETPHFPHNWDACVFYEPTSRVLFSSDVGAQGGVREAVTSENRIAEIIAFQNSFGFMPEGFDLVENLDRVGRLNIEYLATQHGSILQGAKLISQLFSEMRVTLGQNGNGRDKRAVMRCD